mgnify:CR=1 FL=1
MSLKFKKYVCLFGILFLAWMLIGCEAIQAAQKNYFPAIRAKSKMVYLAPDAIPNGEDIPGGSLALSVRGVHIVQDMAELKTWTEQESPEVIMVHQAGVDEIDKKWLAQQSAAHRKIVVFNLSMRELHSLVGSGTFISSGWADWQPKPFYSYIQVSGGGSDSLAPNGISTLDSLLHSLDLN